MKVWYGLEAVDPPLPQSVLTIGNFDGVHRAHQQLLAQAGLFAANTGGPVVVLTFEPHPATIVAPAKAPPRLSPLDEKLRRLGEGGADVVVVARSDRSLLKIEAEDFVQGIIRRHFNPTHIVEGPSFGFGRGRKGTPEFLRKVAGEFGCEVHIVEPITLRIDDGEALMVSSSLIRKLIAEGRVHRAAICLGRAYRVIGKVIKGDGRGRTIGFPTANVAVSDQLIPGDGVYAGRAAVRNNTHPCAISIGRAPTFKREVRIVEAHLLDFDGSDLYGESIAIDFVRPLRGQRSFKSADALAAQLRIDVKTVRAGEKSAGSRTSKEERGA